MRLSISGPWTLDHLCLVSDDRLPNWPPPDGEKITVDDARQIIAWIREHAGPVLEEAERMIRERYPGGEIGRGGW